MKEEIKVFLISLMFYTRIPGPKNIDFTSDRLNRATKYLPFIGIIVGCIGAVVFLLGNLFLPVNASVLFAILGMIFTTGAFHEDGLADFFDGFGGGYTKEKILTIMKDSTIGTYGAIGLILLIVSKILLISEISPLQIPIVIIAAHAFSRAIPVLLIFTSQYVREDITSKSKAVAEKKNYSILIVALLIGFLPLILLLPYFFAVFVSVVIFIIYIYFRYYIHKKIGGYTGDILGTLQQLSEVGFYVSFLFYNEIVETLLKASM